MAFPRSSSPPRRVACKSCAMRHLCRPTGADQNMVQFTKRVAAGERLFRTGARQTGIYALRSGFMMTSLPEINGRRFVLRFMLPGDAVGMEALATGEHPTEATAIEDSEVCVIPVRRAEMLVEFLPAYAAEVRKLLAEQYAEAMAHAILLRRRRADERVALFLLELSRRSLVRGFPPEAFPLPMRRYELGEHLNLRFESVSRTLNELQKKGAIEMDGAAVKIVSLERLREAAVLHSARPVPYRPRQPRQNSTFTCSE